MHLGGSGRSLKAERAIRLTVATPPEISALVMTGDWCGNSPMTLPFLARLVEAAPGMKSRDDSELAMPRVINTSLWLTLSASQPKTGPATRIVTVEIEKIRPACASLNPA